MPRDIFDSLGGDEISQEHDPNEDRDPIGQTKPRLRGTVPQQVQPGHELSGSWRGGSVAGEHEPRRPQTRREPVKKQGWFARLFAPRPVEHEVEEVVPQEGGPTEQELAIIEQRITDYAARISRRANGHRVSVFSHKGGGTKTSNAFGVGNAIGRYSRQGVLLFDGNTDYGTTSIVNGNDNDYDVFDVLEHLDSIKTIQDVRKYTSKSRQSRMEVLSSRRGSERALTGNNYMKVLNTVEEFWPIVISDSGIDFTTRLAETMILATDTPIVCSTHSAVCLSLAEETLKKFQKMDRADLFRRTIVSVVSTTPEPVNEDKIRARFEPYGVKSVVFIPYDKYLGNPDTTLFLWESLSLETQVAWMQLAAEVSDNF